MFSKNSIYVESSNMFSKFNMFSKIRTCFRKFNIFSKILICFRKFEHGFESSNMFSKIRSFFSNIKHHKFDVSKLTVIFAIISTYNAVGCCSTEVYYVQVGLPIPHDDMKYSVDIALFLFHAIPSIRVNPN